MKKYIFHTKAFLVTAALLMLQSCELSEYISDPLDPRLPRYSEEGNNVAGAFLNDIVWKSSLEWYFGGVSNRPYIHSYPEGDSLLITFYGDKGEIAFTINEVDVKDFDDLKALSGRKFLFSENGNKARIGDVYHPTSKSTQVGQIYLKSIKQKKGMDCLIVSGTFGFLSNADSQEVVDVTYGRFDYEFYSYINFEIKD